MSENRTIKFTDLQLGDIVNVKYAGDVDATLRVIEPGPVPLVYVTGIAHESIRKMVWLMGTLYADEDRCPYVPGEFAFQPGFESDPDLLYLSKGRDSASSDPFSREWMGMTEVTHYRNGVVVASIARK